MEAGKCFAKSPAPSARPAYARADLLPADRARPAGRACRFPCRSPPTGFDQPTQKDWGHRAIRRCRPSRAVRRQPESRPPTLICAAQLVPSTDMTPSRLQKSFDQPRDTARCGTLLRRQPGLTKTVEKTFMVFEATELEPPPARLRRSGPQVFNSVERFGRFPNSTQM